MAGSPLLGIDLGSVNVKLVVVGCDVSELYLARPSRGNPLAVARGLLEEAASTLGQDVEVRLAATGVAAPAFTSLFDTQRSLIVNEIVATAVGVSAAHPDVRTIVDLGGQFTKWILIDRQESDDSNSVVSRIADFALNGLCAAGSGAFLEQQAARLRLTPAELGDLAAVAPKGATIAGRCSVFAKSDMIHLQQRGTPVNEIAYGLCQALSRTFTSTVLEGRSVEGPVSLVGGGSSNAGLVRALSESFGLDAAEVIVPRSSASISALGAGLVAEQADHPRQSLRSWIRAASRKAGHNVVTKKASSLQQLAFPSKDRPIVEQQKGRGDSCEAASSKGIIRGHLGIDVGSVSTNVVVLSSTKSLLKSVYVATRGRPVEALDEALGLVAEELGERLEVLSVGATGSGRYLAARLVGADLIKNEITAQLASAMEFFPHVDTIFEIGGQDSKFIDARGGHLRDFEMNKICAAGTGSFLEEQAERLGVNIVEEFARLAFESKAPFDLGSRCTVFMDTELSRAMASEARVEDLCAGLAYSVVRNYLEKVVAGRDIGDLVVFQGGTSANSAVLRAFEQLLGRKVEVHPHGRVSGAIGAALLAAHDMTVRENVPEGKVSPRSQFLGLRSCQGHRADSFECRRCENRCQVTRVRVGDRSAHFGDICERYTERDGTSGARGERASSSKDLFRRRADLLRDHLPPQAKDNRNSDRPRVGLPRASLMFEYLPFWSHLLDELGFEPVFTGEGKASKEGGSGVLPSEVCLPLKLAADEVRLLFEEHAVDRVFLPSILELESKHPGDRTHTCLFAQQLPDMVRPSSGDRLLSPQLAITATQGLAREAARELSSALGVSTRRVRRSWHRAFLKQEEFNRARWRLGGEALTSLSHDEPATPAVVVLGKPYNLHDPRANLGLARHLERIGLFAIPMDLLPLGEERLSSEWYMLAWQLNRDQVRALQRVAGLSQHTPLFPIHVSSYGCGPDAFTVKHLERAWGDRPRLFLEFDEHRGEAGVITRLEAFADEIGEHLERRRKRGASRRLARPEPRDNRDIPPGTRCVLPYTSAHVHAYAGSLRHAGFRTRILDQPDAETLRLGEEVSSGRECHPYSIIAGDLVKLVKHGDFEPGDRYFMPSTRLPCLLGQYGDGFRRILEDLGEDHLKIFDQHPGEATAIMGPRGMVALYEGLTIIDYLIIAGGFLRARELEPGTVDDALEDCYRLVGNCVASARDARACLRRSLAQLAKVPLDSRGPRPVVGVTGDLYTRINAAGNGSLFSRLESMGCIVWASPFFAASTDFELPQDARRWLTRGSTKAALRETAISTLLRTRSSRLASCLDHELRARCVESPQRVLQRYAVRYVGANTNHLVRGLVAKMADFAARGAHGVISAVGLGCMVGTTASSAIPAIRRDFDGLPIISIAYDGSEGPTQQIKLETFVHQVKQRFEASSPLAQQNTTPFP